MERRILDSYTRKNSYSEHRNKKVADVVKGILIYIVMELGEVYWKNVGQRMDAKSCWMARKTANKIVERHKKVDWIGWACLNEENIERKQWKCLREAYVE